MKIRIWDRILIALAGAVLLVFSLCLMICATGLFSLNLGFLTIGGELAFWKRCVIIASAAVLALLGVHGILVLFGRKKMNGFVLSENEYGGMSISMKALETMARKCVEGHEDVTLQKISVEKGDKDITIEMKVLIPGGVSIPRTVGSLQQQIRNYIWDCAGVEVKAVSVMVETDKARLPLALTAPEEMSQAEEILEEIPVEEVPVEEVPAEEAPAEEIPAEEIPVEESPVEETPTEEISEEEETFGEEAPLMEEHFSQDLELDEEPELVSEVKMEEME